MATIDLNDINKVNSTQLVVNLNADRLDGGNGQDYVARENPITNGNIWRSMGYAYQSTNAQWRESGPAFTFGIPTYYKMVHGDYWQNNLFLKTCTNNNNSSYTSWREFAFKDDLNNFPVIYGNSSITMGSRPQWTTEQLISWINSKGGFNRMSWSYLFPYNIYNNPFMVTRAGNIDLSGCLLEVFTNTSTDYIIRITHRRYNDTDFKPAIFQYARNNDDIVDWVKYKITAE